MQTNKRKLSSKQNIIFFVIVFVAALFIRMQYNANTIIPDPIVSDARKYVTIALNLAHKGIYSHAQDAEKSNYMIAPGYPFFLATMIKCIPDPQKIYKSILLVQAIMGALTAAITFAIALYFLPPFLSLCSGLLVALSPQLISLGSYILTETLFTFFLAAATLILMRGIEKKSIPHMIAAGITFGISGLIRSAILLFPLFIAPLILYYATQKKWSITVAFLLSMLITTGTWGTWTKTNPNQNISSENMPVLSFALGMYPNLVYKNKRLRGYPYRDDPSHKYFSQNLKSTLAVLVERAEKEPLKYIKWYLWGKPTMYWSANMIVGQGGIYVYRVVQSFYDTNALAGLSFMMMQFFHPLVLTVVFMGFIALGWTAKRHKEQKCMLAMSIIFAMLFYVTIVHTILAPLPRYSIPFRIPLYLAFCSSIYLLNKHGSEMSKILSRIVKRQQR